ncbi:Core-2/I-branching beta-1,6-N-acetylglucosaminyltransferase family protein [Quillaja saponaria]|uniref:Core-2/I-branching beta-1,6-N-acetylglucosaminyltransferase family protein n=1 Tax=Quillaja saponaria TaxID=32244 RepID=A0AAD7Q6J8_QUISA|nr:Core-2/I-branching beta-1,6-N-acetylglucosaminyltransferase family protein [Quillaja saponaria]
MGADQQYPCRRIISKPFNGLLHVKNTNHVFYLVFTVIGFSLGLITTLCLKSFSLTNNFQAFLYYSIPPSTLNPQIVNSPQSQPSPRPFPTPQEPSTSPSPSRPPIPTPPESSSSPSPSPPPPSPPPILIPPSPSPPPLSFLRNTTFNLTGVTLKEQQLLIMHNMSDHELFKKATMIPSIQDSHDDHVQKVAFMFLTKQSLPLGPLWESFFKGHEGLYSIYVHSDPSYNETLPQDSVFYGRRIPSQPVFWGTATMIDAERRLLANALLEISNQRFVLISESCIPLFNFSTIYDYLMNSNQSFLGSFDDPRKAGRGRYNPKMSPAINITNWRKGSQWFELHRELAIHVVSDQKYYPIFQQYCVPPCYSDEHYIPTLVNILYPELNSNRTITWVDWSRGGAHPRKFGWVDITNEFLNRIQFGSECVYNGNTTNMCFLFARKFLPNTLRPLLKVAPLVLGFNPN